MNFLLKKCQTCLNCTSIFLIKLKKSKLNRFRVETRILSSEAKPQKHRPSLKTNTREGNQSGRNSSGRTPKKLPPATTFLPSPIIKTKNMTEEGKTKGIAFPGDHQPSAPPQPHPAYYYGTFQGVANHQPPYPPPPPTYQPSVGFPQPSPPANIHNHIHHPYYPHGYQTVPGTFVYLISLIMRFTISHLFPSSQFS